MEQTFIGVLLAHITETIQDILYIFFLRPIYWYGAILRMYFAKYSADFAGYRVS